MKIYARFVCTSRPFDMTVSSVSKYSKTPLVCNKTIDNSLPDLSNPPVVVKKMENAREFLRKYPIPKDLKW
jgi:hypothetical protein